MDTVIEISSDPIVQRWSVALVHFLWQGALIATVTGIALGALGRASPNVRYLFCLGALVLLVAAPVATFLLVDGPSGSAVVIAQFAHDGPGTIRQAEDSWASPLGFAVTEESVSAGRPYRQNSTLTGRLRTIDAPSVARASFVAVWVVGQCLLSLRLLLGAWGLPRLRRNSIPIPDDLSAIVARLSRAIGLARAPHVFASNRCADAAAMGFLRPWIVVPSAWLAQMSPDMLEAVIAHELLHVRRRDVWINALQRVAEMLLCFHPAVWWLSRRISEERELCCDAEAIQLTGKPRIYAKTLERVARYHVAHGTLSFGTSLGGDRMSILNRVRFVLHECPTRRPFDWRPAAMVALLVPLCVGVLITRPETKADERTTGQQADGRTLIEKTRYPASSTVSKDADSAPANDTTRPNIPIPNVLAEQDFAIQTVSAPPAKLEKVSLPAYRIEPPDIVIIETVRFAPKPGHRVQTGDELRIVVRGKERKKRIDGVYSVETDGKIELGRSHGKLHVAGLTAAQVRCAVEKQLEETTDSPKVNVALEVRGAIDSVNGEHLVGPDGYVNLGRVGQVYIAGMTINEAKAAIEDQLSMQFDDPKVTVEVFAYNSKVYYVIVQTPGVADQIVRVPCSGNETVLDGLSAVDGLDRLSSRSIFIARPSPNRHGTNQILPVDWNAITRTGSTATNYQLLPGDRLFVKTKDTALDSEKYRTPVDQQPDGSTDQTPSWHLLRDQEKSIESAARRFNQLVREKRYEEAVGLAKTIANQQTQGPVTQLIAEHARLISELHLQPSVSTTMVREITENRRRLAAARLEIWRERVQAEWRVREQLRQKLEVKYNKSPLRAVLEDISKKIGVDVYVDPRALASEGVTTEIPISLNLTQSISARTALNLILEPLRLKHVVADGMLKVTSEALSDQFYVVTYKASDLLRLMQPDSDASPEPYGKTAAPTQEDYDKLLEFIVQTIAPDSWDQAGGSGVIKPFPTNGSLVVSQTREIHEQIAELLKQLRDIKPEPYSSP